MRIDSYARHIKWQRLCILGIVSSCFLCRIRDITLNLASACISTYVHVESNVHRLFLINISHNILMSMLSVVIELSEQSMCADTFNFHILQLFCSLYISFPCIEFAVTVLPSAWSSCLQTLKIVGFRQYLFILNI